MKNHKINIVLPYNIVYLPILLNAINVIAKLMGFDKNHISKLETAAEETVSNVIRYAYTKNDESTFEVVLEMQTMGLLIIIKENDIPAISDPGDNSDNEYREFTNIIVKKLVDKVWFQGMGKDGFETHLFSYLKKYNFQLAHIDKSKNSIKEELELIPKSPVSYEIRQMKPHEAIDVSEVAYCTYGNTYLHPDIYYPDRVRELNRKKQLLSLIAITEHDKIIAHIAFERSADKYIPEIGIAFTVPEYRGMGCMGRLLSASLDEARKMAFPGVFAQGVTSHPYSQKTLYKFRFRDCAILLSMFHKLTFEDIDQNKPQRESVALSFRYLTPPEKMIIYPPEHHTEMIANLYENIGFVPEIRKSNKLITPYVVSSVLSVKTDLDNFTADITVVTFGKNILAEVLRVRDNLCHNHFAAVYLRISLTDPFTAKYTAEFENMGFFFAGILPRSSENDELILQYLNSHMIDFEQLKINSDKGKELLEYIKNLLPNPGSKVLA